MKSPNRMTNCAGASHGACVAENTLGVRCSSCNVAWYCSPKHQKKDAKNHLLVCKRWAKQAELGSLLDDFPFSFPEEAKEMGCCMFLEKHGIHKRLLWKSECECAQATFSWGLSFEGLSWDLPHEQCPCKDQKVRLTSRLQNWSEYYAWRELPLDSVSALLLHWPLTLYRALHIVSPKVNLNRDLHIHYLGPERELDQLLVFGELLELFPDINISIDFIGPRVHPLRNGHRVQLNTTLRCSDSTCNVREWVKHNNHVNICLRRGLYHDVHTELFAPDLVFAPNAGIAAFVSWRPTIIFLGKVQVPLVVTDYCEEASLLAVDCISKACIGRESIPVQVNPFKQPLVPHNKCIDLPMYSNCFIFGFY